MRLFTSLLLTYCIAALFAQELPPLPLDPQTRTGKLDNGLTYYIRHNEEPKNRIEFQIAQKVGSMQEEENQRGLAHFLEHMAFNGIKSFPGDKDMLNYLQSRGLSFGNNINAYTSFERTVYRLSDVPADQNGLVDSCLLILHDWSSHILLTEKDIDEERGVIREEWRTWASAFMRMIEKGMPDIYRNSRYGVRLPIGTLDVINNFTYQEIRDYYHKWYHPGNQAIIIVGDFDIDAMEAKVKQRYSELPKIENPAPVVEYPVPNNDEPLITIQTDKEAPATGFNLFFKYDALPIPLRSTISGFQMSLINNLINAMFTERIADITNKPNTPFVSAEIAPGNFLFSDAKNAITCSAMTKENEAIRGLKGLYTEVLRADRYGFLPSELERAKANYLSALEKRYNERNKTTNYALAAQLAANFCQNLPAAGAEFNYNTAKQILPNINIQVINQLFGQMVSEKNIACFIFTVDKEGVTAPTQQDVLDILEKTRQSTIEPLKDEGSDKPLIPILPKAGKVTKTTTDKMGNTVWILSNGIKVVLRKTDYKEDEITFQAYSDGGMSLYNAKDRVNYALVEYFATCGGLGEHSATQLEKILSGKIASAAPAFNDYDESISGASSVKDFETMLQLTYLNFTALRKDPEAYQANLEKIKNILEQQEVMPQVELIDSVIAVQYKNDWRKMRLKASELDQVNYDEMLRIARERLANPADFTFLFVGNLDLETARPLIEKYIGSLKTSKKKEKVNSQGVVALAKGDLSRTFNKIVETPKTTVNILYSGILTNEWKHQAEISMLGQILRIVYTREVREKEGGTYGVAVRTALKEYPKGESTVSINFDTNQEQAPKLIEIIEREIALICDNGPISEDFEMVKLNMLKSYDENIRKNPYWMGQMKALHKYGQYSNPAYRSYVESLTPQSIKTLSQKLFSQKNKINLVMNGIIKEVK